MTHVHELLSSYLDGELSPKERIMIDEHIVYCEPCKKHLEELKAAIQAVRSKSLTWAPPAGFIQRILNRMKEPDKNTRKKLVRLWPSTAVAFAGLLAVFIFRELHQIKDPTSPPLETEETRSDNEEAQPKNADIESVSPLDQIIEQRLAKESSSEEHETGQTSAAPEAHAQKSESLALKTKEEAKPAKKDSGISDASAVSENRAKPAFTAEPKIPLKAKTPKAPPAQSLPPKKNQLAPLVDAKKTQKNRVEAAKASLEKTQHSSGILPLPKPPPKKITPQETLEISQLNSPLTGKEALPFVGTHKFQSLEEEACGANKQKPCVPDLETKNASIEGLAGNDIVSQPFSKEKLPAKSNQGKKEWTGNNGPQKKLNQVARNESDWQKLWAKISKGTAPKVDFSKSIAVAIFVGNMPGYAPSILSSSTRKDKIIVFYRFSPRSATAKDRKGNFAYLIKLFPRTNLKVEFQKQ